MTAAEIKAPALAATLAVAVACWVVAVQRMDGMDMGVATDLGSFGFFAAAWVPMMAAMMLPGAAAALLRRVGGPHAPLDVPLFLGSYVAVWAVVGLAVYALYRPHGSTIAGALVIAAGAYELTPLKREFRVRCRESVRSGLELGVLCVGSSIGLMVVLLAVGAMSVTWMAIVGAVVLAQKLAPPVTALDVPLALAVIGLGALIVVAPDVVPGLMPSM